MRYAPRAILAGGLGFAVSCVAACGGGAGLLSGGQSIALSGQGNEISAALQAGNCGAAINASKALGNDVKSLPVTVNPELRKSLSDGAATIAQLAATDCHPHTTRTTTSTPTTTSSSSTTSSTSSTTTPTTSSTSSTTTPTSTTSSTATSTTNTGTSNTTTSGGVGLGGGTTTGTGNGGTGGAGAGNGNGNGGGGNGGGG